MSGDVLEKYYEVFLAEVQTTASPEVPATYKGYLRAFDAYLGAVQKDLFKQAFQYGYEQGLKSGKMALLLR